MPVTVRHCRLIVGLIATAVVGLTISSSLHISRSALTAQVADEGAEISSISDARGPYAGPAPQTGYIDVVGQDGNEECDGNECMLFGDLFCADQEKKCTPTPSSPCFVCVDPAGEASSQESQMGVQEKQDEAVSANNNPAPSACGDGMVQQGEECGEKGLQCPEGQLCTMATCRCGGGGVCGNGTADMGEQCGEPGLSCPAGQGCNTATCLCDGGGLCGNGGADPGEQCGEPGLQCAGFASCDPVRCLCSIKGVVTLTAQAECGDGQRQPGEECDDGNLLDEDGCSSACFLEEGSCGDNIVQRFLGEQCEATLHDEELPYICTPRCRYFSGSKCGNGDLDAGEECDMGKRNSDAPDAKCRMDCGLARCGDGVLDLEREACDDGNRIPKDGCDRFCRRDRAERKSSAQSLANQDMTFLGRSSPRPVREVTLLPFAAAPLETHRPPHNAATGPAAALVMLSGASAGWAWMRRKR